MYVYINIFTYTGSFLTTSFYLFHCGLFNQNDKNILTDFFRNLNPKLTNYTKNLRGHTIRNI